MKSHSSVRSALLLGTAVAALVADRLWAAGLDTPSFNIATSLNQPPRKIISVDPVYPFECRKAGVHGEVIVDFLVNPDGKTASVHAVYSPDPRLSEAAVRAVSQWLFIPGETNGVANVTHLQIPLTFNLDGTPQRLETVKPDHLPVAIFEARPQYPPEFAAKQVEGQVVVKFIVCPDGSTTEALAVSASDRRLTAFAIDAVLKWKFKPGTKDGKPVYCAVEVPVEFKAEKPKADVQSDTDFGPSSSVQPKLASAAAAMDQKKYDEAIGLYTQAIQGAPDTAPGYIGRAGAFAALGRDDEALDDYEKAGVIDPVSKAALEAFKAKRKDTPEAQWSLERYRTFDMVWRTVNDSYYDPTFGGVDWVAVREKYRLQLPGAADSAHLVPLLQQMLGELKLTHFTIIPRKAAVFNPTERVRIGSTGIDVAWIDNAVVIKGVSADSKGVKANVSPGDQVTKVDKHVLAELRDSLEKAKVDPSRAHLYLTGLVESRLSSAVGTKVTLEVCSPGGEPRTVEVTCGPTELPWSEPVGFFPSIPIRCTAEVDADGVGTFSFNAFVPPVMKQYRAFEKTLVKGNCLIIDLRGNGGGLSTMASGMCGWLCSEPFVLASMRQRTGSVDLSVYPQTHLFTGPVAVLIDGQSASTSEILAAGLKERGRARIFGEKSAGAALPSFFKTLPNGDLLQYAIADVKTPHGGLIEGNGVIPDEVVLKSRADLDAGKDPVLLAARRWLAQALGDASKPKDT